MAHAWIELVVGMGHPQRGMGRRMCLALGLGLAVAGCTSPGAKTGTEPSARLIISQLHLLTMPMALNLDGTPGADGFAVKVFAVAPEEPKPVALTTGTLEIFMYDGVFADRVGDTVKPLRVWTYSAADLRSYAFKKPVGIGYSFVLQWGDIRPTEKKITVLARFSQSGAKPVSSAPSAIVVVSP